jgi:predicted RNA binding protein YcfA (HicA-like mRNA interferase family)
MSYPKSVWNQIKNRTPKDFITALKKDGWEEDASHGSVKVFRNPEKNLRVTIHMHPGKTYGAKMLNHLIEDIGWSVDDMRKLKFIK